MTKRSRGRLGVVAPKGRPSIAQGVSPGYKPKTKTKPRRGDRDAIKGVASAAPSGLPPWMGRHTQGLRPGLLTVAPSGLKDTAERENTSPVHIPRTGRRRHQTLLRTCLLFAFGFICPTAPAQAPARPVFVVHGAAGNPIKGAIKSIDEKWNVTLDGGPALKVNGADLISIRRADLPLPGPPAASPHVVFANGDRLPGTFGELTGEKLTFRTSLSKPGRMTLPLSRWRCCGSKRPPGWTAPTWFADGCCSKSEPATSSGWRNGDQLHGNVLALSRNALQIEVDRKEMKLDRNKIAVIVAEQRAGPHAAAQGSVCPAGPRRRLPAADSLRSALMPAH